MTATGSTSITFEFSRRDEGTERTGFDLGDIRVVGSEGEVYSSGKIPDQGMMIYISLSELLSGLKRNLKKGKPGTYDFVAADSSFRLRFSLLKRSNLVELSSGSVKIAAIPLPHLLEAVTRAARDFWNANPLDEPDPVYCDLQSELQGFTNR